MGTYLHFALGGPDGLRTQLLSDFADYSSWITQLTSEYPHEFSRDFLAKMGDILRRGDKALNANSKTDAQLIDRIVDEYWEYCSSQNLHQDKVISLGMYHRRRYSDDLLHVFPKANKQTCQYYRTLFLGRSLANYPDHHYQSEDGVFHLSWLLPDEVSHLLDDLTSSTIEHNQLTDFTEGALQIIHAAKLAKSKESSLIVVTA